MNDSGLTVGRMSLYFMIWSFVTSGHVDNLCMLIFLSPSTSNWFDNGIPCIYILALLSCNLKLYPGTDTLYSSSVCKPKVSDSDKALYCNIYEQWIHKACDPS